MTVISTTVLTADLVKAREDRDAYEAARRGKPVDENALDLRARVAAADLATLLAHVEWLAAENARLEERHTGDCRQAWREKARADRYEARTDVLTKALDKLADLESFAEVRGGLVSATWVARIALAALQGGAE